MPTGIVILAAGNSNRMGRPKQLLTYEGKTLLGIVCEEAWKTEFRPVVVVTGAHSPEVLAAHAHPAIHYVNNDAWESGMASSIVRGMESILELSADMENVIIAVADQVFIRAEVFEQLEQKQVATGKAIIASKYAETIGTPVLFNKKYFGQLEQLRGDSGAKKILASYSDEVDTIAFEKGETDIDTESDYQNLISKQ